MYLFKHMLKGTAWFITRQRHWLDWSDQTSSLKKVSGWSVQLIQPACLCHSAWDLCVWQCSGHQITQEYGRLLLWFIIDERRVFVCSVCDEVHSGRRFHGRDRARFARWWFNFWWKSSWADEEAQSETSTHPHKDSLLFAHFVKHVAALKPWWTEPANMNPPVGWTSVLSLNPPAWTCGDANKMFWKVIVITL